MNVRHIVAAAFLFSALKLALGAEKCMTENRFPEGQSDALNWVDQMNWLSPENLRIGLQSGQRFMSHVRITLPNASARPRAIKQLSLESIKINDPVGHGEKTAEFVFNSRIYADGVVVLRDGKIVSERYWNDLTPQMPRLLLGATQPIVSVLGAIALSQGKLEQDKSVLLHIPELSSQKGLRRLSIQRLLDGSLGFGWGDSEIKEWEKASGWNNESSSDVRAWLNTFGRWEGEIIDNKTVRTNLVPESDLLIWALDERYKKPVSRTLCDNVFSRMKLENPAIWLTDKRGRELSGGLALSLRDFAYLGQFLIDARNSPNRTKLPGWFVETLAAPSGARKANYLKEIGFGTGSDLRYGFVHLGGRGSRIAIIGPYGNSLYVDFDRNVVVAIYASYPRAQSEGLFATLQELWELLSTIPASGKQR